MKPSLTCDLCGVYLYAEHAVTIHIDGRLYQRLTVCLNHLDLLRELLADTLEPRLKAVR